jgi:radical SAM superfamily enzyme YgiQ (UPF0313 family)
VERGQAFELIRLARRTAPKCIIVVGGQHATAFPSHLLLKTPADFVVLGEGELAFGELLAALSCDKDYDSIAGISFRKEDKIVVNPQRPFIRDLDELPLPLHEQFDYRHYRGMADTPRRAAAIITSRGCPFNCIFCSSSTYWGRRYRVRSVDNVLAEVDLLYHQYGVRAILFFDDNLTIDRQRCIALSNALHERQLDLVWAAEGSVKVDVELLEAMKRGGCYRIDFGVESGSPQILKNINKSTSVEDTRRAFALCKEVGIKPNAYLIFGSPGESRRTIRETARLMTEIQPENVGPFRSGLWILPNTRLHEMSVHAGLVSEERWLADDSTFIYTAEHTQMELNALAMYYHRIMVRRGLLQPWRDFLELWRQRLRRLARDPLSLFVFVRKRLKKWNRR